MVDDTSMTVLALNSNCNKASINHVSFISMKTVFFFFFFLNDLFL